MNFSSPVYAVFLFFNFAVFWALKDNKYRALRHIFLLITSYVFYCWWAPIYGTLLVGSTILDYWVGAKMAATDDAKRRKLLLGVSMLGNLGTLAFFKYYDFFAWNTNELLGFAGVQLQLTYLRMTLPPGISFYSFQTLSYSLDLYKKTLKRSNNLMEFSLFVAFFPQLVAGPIVRAAEFLDQFDRIPKYEEDEVSEGLYRVIRGVMKKVIIGDFVGQLVVDPVFHDLDNATALDIYLAAIGFHIQVYGDFSGYSDIAIGSAKMMGFDIPENFNRPMFATSPADFWRRWHLTLTLFLRDYLYIPTGGNHPSKWRRGLASIITFTVCGFWHGASWNYVLFGFWHGIFVAGENILRKTIGWDRKKETSTLGSIFGFVFTLHYLIIAMLMFRSGSMGDFWHTLQILFGKPFSAGSHLIEASGFGVLALAWASQALPASVDHAASKGWRKLHGVAQGLILAVFFALVAILQNELRPFVYFQF
jgi:alginate O-acetyltransferase complex protein AlgI